MGGADKSRGANLLQKEWMNRPTLTEGKVWVTGMDPSSSRLWVSELFSRVCFWEGLGSRI